MIELALVIVGFLPEGEDASPEALIDAKDLLNQMLGMWSNDRLIVPVISMETFSLPGKSAVTIGPGGDFDTLPLSSLQAITVSDENGTSRDVFILNEDSFSDLVDIPVVDMPIYACYLDAYPVGTIMFNAVPPSGCTAKIRSTKPFTSFATLTESMSFPPGYDMAIQYGLVVLLKTKYGKPITEADYLIAKNSYDNLKDHRAANKGVPLAKMDAGLGCSSRSFNINRMP